MDKKLWYKNRILWKAKQHFLPAHLCYVFDEVSAEKRAEFDRACSRKLAIADIESGPGVLGRAG